MRALVWDANDEGAGRGLAREPRGCYRGARVRLSRLFRSSNQINPFLPFFQSNIFSLAWSSDGSKLIS
jgi:hypothetical protein